MDDEAGPKHPLEEGLQHVAAYLEELQEKQVRTSPTGREATVTMGRTKFGKVFALCVDRRTRQGSWERLDLATVGLDGEALEYLNQAEADAVLERIAAAFEGPILAWLDEP
jgi:hypothetical protein